MVQDDDANKIYAVAVKSGPSVFNADSKKRQEQSFMAVSKLAQQAKARYEAYIDIAMGSKGTAGAASFFFKYLCRFCKNSEKYLRNACYMQSI